jgi:hypothetical protein
MQRHCVGRAFIGGEIRECLARVATGATTTVLTVPNSSRPRCPHSLVGEPVIPWLDITGLKLTSSKTKLG